ncbi:hypothetical protein [Streptomyces sp. P9(2023)]|nr:hypothetical protein [Streptomyces sp. P9(2023)]
MLCTEASDTLTPWLAAWKALDDRAAERRGFAPWVFPRICSTGYGSSA